MELLIKDRLFFPALLPKENNLLGFNLKQSILKKIEISEEERNRIGLQENPESNRIEWDVAKDLPLLVEFPQQEMDYLKSACEKISDQNLPDDMWTTVEKIYNALQE